MLRTERDFFELADAYLAKAAAQRVRRAEIFFDPQAHTRRCGGNFEVLLSSSGRAGGRAGGQVGS